MNELLEFFVSQYPRRSLYDVKDRRSKVRFPITQEVDYVVLSIRGQPLESGTGQTLNISSNGLRFTTNNPLHIGNSVNLTMNFPALVNDTKTMQIRIHGTVLRSDRQATTVSIERCEFRTRALVLVPLEQLFQEMSA